MGLLGKKNGIIKYIGEPVKQKCKNSILLSAGLERFRGTVARTSRSSAKKTPASKRGQEVLQGHLIFITSVYIP